MTDSFECLPTLCIPSSSGKLGFGIILRLQLLSVAISVWQGSCESCWYTHQVVFLGDKRCCDRSHIWETLVHKRLRVTPYDCESMHLWTEVKGQNATSLLNIHRLTDKNSVIVETSNTADEETKLSPTILIPLTFPYLLLYLTEDYQVNL
jgi:hypothetical protein